MPLQNLGEVLALVGGVIIQQDNDGTAQMPEQLPKEDTDFLLADVIEKQQVVEIQSTAPGTDRDSGNDRNLVPPSLPMTMDRRLSGPRPALDDVGNQQKARFIGKTMWASNRVAFFYPRPVPFSSSVKWPLHPAPVRDVPVSGDSIPDDASAHMIPVILNAELAPDHFRNPGRRPQDWSGSPAPGDPSATPAPGVSAASDPIVETAPVKTSPANLLLHAPPGIPPTHHGTGVAPDPSGDFIQTVAGNQQRHARFRRSSNSSALPFGLGIGLPMPTIALFMQRSNSG